MLSNAEFDATSTTDIVVDGYVDMAYFSDLINISIIILFCFTNIYLLFK